MIHNYYTILIPYYYNYILKQRKKDPELPELNLENSVAVVSFTERNIDRHLRIARTVTGDYPIHPTYVGGVNNVKSIELNSKVWVFFKTIPFVVRSLFFSSGKFCQICLAKERY